MMKMLLLVLLLLCVSVCVKGRVGVDSPHILTTNTWTTLQAQYATNQNNNINNQNKGVQFVLFHIWNGTFDQSIVPSIALTRNANSNKNINISAYMYPCVPSAPYSINNGRTCGSPTQQLSSLLTSMTQNGLSFRSMGSSNSNNYLINRLYITIEDEVPAVYFNINATINKYFLAELVSAAKMLKIDVGIYTTRADWDYVMGGTTSSMFSSLPLWTPKYDSQESFSFYSQFGGWTKPSIKQISGGDRLLRRFGKTSRVCLNYIDDLTAKVV